MLAVLCVVMEWTHLMFMLFLYPSFDIVLCGRDTSDGFIPFGLIFLDFFPFLEKKLLF